MKSGLHLIMLKTIFLVFLFLFQLSVYDGASRAYKIFQTPPSIIKKPGESVVMRKLVPEDEGLYFCAGGYQTPQILNSSFIHHWDFYWIIEHCKTKRKLF
ncbi:hypothetical protein AMECASPLE_019179 [Ameca splendens]|uniref:Immunoglobulin V-set domain-containing protein n=1 Tax=Ameca splendens TaxID=208324 RepID=A0ABV0Y2R8_9TELE